jgi:hypothetical protein
MRKFSVLHGYQVPPDEMISNWNGVSLFPGPPPVMTISFVGALVFRIGDCWVSNELETPAATAPAIARQIINNTRRASGDPGDCDMSDTIVLILRLRGATYKDRQMGIY